MTQKVSLKFGILKKSPYICSRKSDYNCFYQVTEQDIADSFELVRQFIDAVEGLINLED